MFSPEVIRDPTEVPPHTGKRSLTVLPVLSSISAKILEGIIPLIPPPSIASRGLYSYSRPFA